MASIQPQPHSFTAQDWLTGQDTRARRPRWRGRVKHVPSGGNHPLLHWSSWTAWSRGTRTNWASADPALPAQALGDRRRLAPLHHLPQAHREWVDIAGGIRTIAPASAFVATADHGVATTAHLLRVTTPRGQKIGKPLTVSDLGPRRPK